MMVNARRGEISAKLDGKDHTLCLTLGALASLEDAFGVGDMVSLGERFASGRLSAKDMMAVIAAGLKGAGSDMSLDQVALMQADGGIAGFADIVSRLLLATFEQKPDGQAKAAGTNP
jgi:hypothetical protein